MYSTRKCTFFFLAAALVTFLMAPSVALAGKLLLTTTSDKPITCTVDRYAKPVIVPLAVTLAIGYEFRVAIASLD